MTSGTISGVRLQTNNIYDVPLIMGSRLQTYNVYNMPLLMGVRLQSLGSLAVVSYPISFNITDVSATVYSYPVDFSVIAGSAASYQVAFNVVEKHPVNYLIDFDVVSMTEYPVEFNIVGPVTHLYGINFDVVGPRYYSGTASFNILDVPNVFYPINFTVVQNVNKGTMISYYVHSGISNVGVPVSVTPTPSGSGVAGRYILNFKIYEGGTYVSGTHVSGSYIGGNDASIRITSGAGINVDFLGIPEIYPGSMTIYTYNKGSLIHAHSGTYQQYLGVKVL